MPLIKEANLSSLCLAPFVSDSVDHMIHGLISGFLYAIHLFFKIALFLCQYHTSLITVSLNYIFVAIMGDAFSKFLVT